MKYSVSHNQGHGEPWLITYSDMVTLLMALFIVLLSVSKIDQNKAEEVAAAMKKSVSSAKTQMPFHDLKTKIDKMIQDNHLEKQVTATMTNRGVDIEFSSSVFFNAGRAEMLPAAIPLLDNTAKVLRELALADVLINVEGHTDDIPIHTVQFASNWELSTARATMVVRHLLNKGVNEKILQAMGLAATRPKVPNRDAAGKAITVNQAANRRVVIRLIR
ncbi:MAG: flagellar motor protein MotB [Cyanobacteria bacterium NC_groundwater_1444_Ag_S-0.65um_54_12]|nr:flagellar motor protein MotB [Cyanobacteria bacterium NC_groundwater_1444_Ag_S-0.65um_54_12]